MRDVSYDVVVHEHHGFCCPFDPARLERLVRLLPLERDAKVLDLGCGKAELLIRIAAHHKVQAVGVDIVEAYLDVGRARAREAGVAGSLDLRHGDVASFEAAPHGFDLTVAIGMTAFGSPAETLERLRHWTKPGGLILLGADYWKGMAAEDDADPERPGRAQACDLTALMTVGRSLGCTLLYAMVATDEERDHFYGLSALAVEQRARAGGSREEAFRARLRQSRDEYFDWAREKRGFALQLLAA